MNPSTVLMDDEHITELFFNGHKVAQIEFSVSEQKLEIAVYERGEPVSNPILYYVHTGHLGHTEDSGE